MKQGTNTGAWISVRTFTVNGAELGDQERHDAPFLSYGINSTYFPTHFDGCSSKISICHSLDYKKVSLITTNHSEFFDVVADLAGKYFTPLHVCYNPLIHKSHTVQ